MLEFEELLEGMDEYSKDIEAEMNGDKNKTKLEGKEGINYLINTFRK